MNKWLMSALLILSSYAVQAKPFFYTGELVSINAETIAFDDIFFTLSPTVKVWTTKKNKTSWRVLKAGDYVTVKMIKIGKKTLVDHIYITTFGRRD